MKNTLTIWKLPEAMRPDDGFSSYLSSLSLSFSETLVIGYFKLKAHSHGIYFRLRNLSVTAFLCPQRTLLKSRTPSTTPSTTISGIVKLLTSSTLYLAPFLTSNTTALLSLPNLLVFFVASVTTTITSSPGPSFDLSGAILY